MYKKFLAGLVLVFLIGGCAAMMTVEEREKMYGQGVPVITESFASKQLYPGDTWNVYLKASDPEGDMEQIVATVDLVGSGTHPVSYTKIKDGNRKELSGYVHLSTWNPSGYGWLTSLTLTLTVQVKDRAGHLSKPVIFPLSFHSRYAQEPPPSGVFQEQSLGPIMITLRSFHDDGRSGDGFF